MSEALAIITGDIYATRDAFEAVSVDRSLNFEREAGFAVQIVSANEFLLKIAMDARQSMVNAVTNIAAIGLSLNPAKKQAYLVPRKGPSGKVQVCLDISYMGLVELAVSCGAILWAQAHPVREHDNFKRRNDGMPPDHDFKEFGDRGEIVGVYVVAKLPTGDFLTEVMDVAEINAIRDRSESYKSGKNSPWKTDWLEMAKKTVAKRASKWWRGHGNTERLDNAIALLNTEGGEGFGPVHNEPVPQVLGFNVDAFIAEARKQTDEQALTKVYAEAMGVAAKSGDREGASRFKEAALAHRAVLRKRAADNTIEMERKAA